MEKSKKGVYERAISTYGPKMQKVVAIEEMSELQKELCKSLRGQSNRDAIVEEIADVEIMLEQLKLMYDCIQDVGKVKAQKIARLAKRLNAV
jgi:hypothetical protein